MSCEGEWDVREQDRLTLLLRADCASKTKTGDDRIL